MKLINKSIYVLSLAGMLGLWSCTADEEMAGMENSGKQIPVTITVSRAAMPDTRTVLTEDGNGNLTDVWSEADQLALVDATGEQVGTLEFQEYVSEDNKSTAVFEGTMNATGEGTKPYRIWYLGAGGSPYSKFATFTNGGNETFNCVQTILSAQSGKFEDLVKGDLMHAVVDLNIQENHAVVEKSVTMTKLLAMARFSLKEAASVTNGKLTITSSNTSGSNQLYYRLSYYCKDAEIAESMASASEFITIENVNTSNDVYVVLPTVKDFHLTFTLTSGNDTWTYTTAGTNTLEAGKYYCNADGTGIRIALEKEQEEEVVDHSKNPLLKWAESDLKRTGSGASVKADFASDYTITGSYYQFGRNYGYNSVADAAQNYGVERSDMASNRNVYAGTGSTSIVSTYYASTIDFSKYPNHFFIDNNHGGDYTAPAHGQEWYDRAKSNGYSYDSPCPDGWRLPTVAEYKEILPVINDKAGNTGNSAWNTLEQFKTFNGGTKDEIKCAFRWSKEVIGNYSYLKIECLVVRTNEDDLKNVDWNDKNVVVRYFKGAGYIQAHRNLWNLTNGGTHYTGRPLEWGAYVGEVESVGYGNAVVVVSQTESYMNRGGFYWTSDEVQGVFSMIFNSSTGYTLGYYLTQYERPIGVNIRCVRK